MASIPHFYRQMCKTDCGPTALRILLSIFKMHVQQWDITSKVPCGINGWSVKEFCQASSNFSLQSTPYNITLDNLQTIELPIVLLFNGHYVVCYRIKSNQYFIADPNRGRLKLSEVEMVRWLKNGNLIAIKCTTTPDFLNLKSTKDSNIQTLNVLFEYFRPYRGHLLTLLLIVLVVCVAQLFIPFIARAIIDKGLATSSSDFLLLLLIGNAILILAAILGNFTQTYLVTHVTNRVKVNMLNQYIEKVLRLPMKHFAQSNVGDLVQRVRDSERIQGYVVGVFFSSIVSFLFLIIFSAVLLYFSSTLFWVALGCSVLYIGWICLFLNERKKIDLDFWELQSSSNKHVIDIYKHMFDIKLFGLHERFENKWRSIIVDQHKQNIRFLKFSQMQDVGANIIAQGKDIALTYIACYFVLQGEITLGSLFAIQYLLGMISSPLAKLASFMDQTQLAVISINRIIAFNKQEEDVPKEKENWSFTPIIKYIVLDGIAFKYFEGTIALKNISLRMNIGQKVSIVGPSGCGKSTVLKILSGLLTPSLGEYYLGTSNTKSLNWNVLRDEYFSTFLQENEIIDGTILENIIGDIKNFDESRLIHAVEGAYMRREFEMMPDGYNTLVGNGNRKLSNGQKQRLLLARALYKETEIYLFDEITNGLSIEFEKKIIDKIDQQKSKSLRVYVSHRGEALVNSDLIIVLDKGHIVACGTHNELLKQRNYYSSLFTAPIAKEAEHTPYKLLEV